MLSFFRRNYFRDDDKSTNFVVAHKSSFSRIFTRSTTTGSRSTDIKLTFIDKSERSTVRRHTDHEFFLWSPLFHPFSSAVILLKQNDDVINLNKILTGKKLIYVYSRRWVFFDSSLRCPMNKVENYDRLVFPIDRGNHKSWRLWNLNI